VIGNLIGEPLERLLDRMRGPGSRRLFEFVELAQLHRPIMIDADDAAIAVRPYAWLLGRIGNDGIRLTGAGHLPPAVVTEAMAVLGDRVNWIGKANREEHTPPVFELRESARRCRLVRKYKGALVLTPAGRTLRSDPVALWWHLAAELPKGRDDIECDAGTTLLLAVAPVSRSPGTSRAVSSLMAFSPLDGDSPRPASRWTSGIRSRPPGTRGRPSSSSPCSLAPGTATRPPCQPRLRPHSRARPCEAPCRATRRRRLDADPSTCGSADSVGNRRFELSPTMT